MSKPSNKQLAQITLDSMNKTVFVRQLAAYLVKERRTRDLAPIMREAMRLRAAQGIIEVEATTAYPIADEVEKAISKLLLSHKPGAKQVILGKKRDEEAVGGVRITANDLYLDNTVHGRLNRLKQLKLERK